MPSTVNHLLTEETLQEQFCYGCRIVLTHWASSVSMWLSTHVEHHLMLRVYFRIAKLVAILPFDGHLRFSEMKLLHRAIRIALVLANSACLIRHAPAHQRVDLNRPTGLRVKHTDVGQAAHLQAPGTTRPDLTVQQRIRSQPCMHHHTLPFFALGHQQVMQFPWR